jgi:hypothetical protein
MIQLDFGIAHLKIYYIVKMVVMLLLDAITTALYASTAGWGDKEFNRTPFRISAWWLGQQARNVYRIVTGFRARGLYEKACAVPSKDIMELITRIRIAFTVDKQQANGLVQTLKEKVEAVGGYVYGLNDKIELPGKFEDAYVHDIYLDLFRRASNTLSADRTPIERLVIVLPAKDENNAVHYNYIGIFNGLKPPAEILRDKNISEFIVNNFFQIVPSAAHPFVVASGRFINANGAEARATGKEVYNSPTTLVMFSAPEDLARQKVSSFVSPAEIQVPAAAEPKKSVFADKSPENIKRHATRAEALLYEKDFKKLDQELLDVFLMLESETPQKFLESLERRNKILYLYALQLYRAINKERLEFFQSEYSLDTKAEKIVDELRMLIAEDFNDRAVNVGRDSAQWQAQMQAWEKRSFQRRIRVLDDLYRLSLLYPDAPINFTDRLLPNIMYVGESEIKSNWKEYMAAFSEVAKEHSLALDAAQLEKLLKKSLYGGAVDLSNGTRFRHGIDVAELATNIGTYVPAKYGIAFALPTTNGAWRTYAITPSVMNIQNAMNKVQPSTSRNEAGVTINHYHNFLGSIMSSWPFSIRTKDDIYLNGHLTAQNGKELSIGPCTEISWIYDAGRPQRFERVFREQRNKGITAARAEQPRATNEISGVEGEKNFYFAA